MVSGKRAVLDEAETLVSVLIAATVSVRRTVRERGGWS
jgi:hypothetical protein